MATSIMATKLYIPPIRPKVVSRPRLVELLNEALYSKLTIISAPVGYGKTTLVSEWVTCCERPVAWLSLDKGDSDPARFLMYLVAALQTITANIGEGVMDLLQALQMPPIETFLTGLLNEIAAFPHHFTLVLDDYHVIDTKAVNIALTFLLEHLPPQMHLVIASREDPNLPLARLRAQGQLTELRAADLRFTPAEAAEFLNQVMGVDISADDVATLETRTEGWIAGLQLAALSTRGRKDVHEFISAFAGDNRYIGDYLVEEVLQLQPESVRSFLLQTSILDWLCGPLCEAVTTQQEGKAMLETLERGNLFVSALDDKRYWFRYHYLFADVLHVHLMKEQPDQVPSLHQRASEWYEHNGSVEYAIRHALAAEDFERAADLVELAMPAMNRNRQLATLLGWLKALPDEVVRVRPVLSAGYASVSLSSGELEGVDARLQDAERWLDTTEEMREQSESPAAGMIVVDEEEFRRLPSMIALIRAGQALARGDMTETVKNARRAFDLASEDDHMMRGGTASQLGLAAWTSGDLETARRMTADGMANLRLAGYISASIGCAIVLADIQIAQGHLHEAMTTYERAVQWATEPSTPVLRGAADMYVGMSNLHREYNDLKTATHYLLKSQALGEFAGLPQNPYRWCAAMAHVQAAQGNLDEALNLLDQAERLYDGDFSPNVRPLAARKTRVWLAQGRLGETIGWASEQGLSPEDDISYLREFEHITLVRILLARYKNDHTDSLIRKAIELLERLLKAAEEGGRMGSAIEILVLKALAHHTQGELPAALVPLVRALMLAETEGYVRIFLDEGSSMAKLLREAAARGIMPGYTGKLLAAFDVEHDKLSLPTSSASPSLIEPLTQRELEILRLLKTELSVPEIARELVIAASTVRTHTKSIYNKLNVNNRRAAVKRAVELGSI